MARTVESYIHRVGRTARWGHSGTRLVTCRTQHRTSNSHTHICGPVGCGDAIPGKSVTFISEQDRKVFKEIMKSTNQKVSNRVIPPKVPPSPSPARMTRRQGLADASAWSRSSISGERRSTA
jgi:superfamily II DNA/RNA helicase